MCFMDDSLTHWIALHQALHMTAHLTKPLLEALSEPFDLTHAISTLKLTPTQHNRLKHIDWQQVENTRRWAQEETHHIITYHNRHYPSLLKEIPDPPVLLYIIGDPSLLNRRQLAIVGSRKPTHGGQQSAKQFAYQLARAGLVITSGLALGIDGCAHQGALAANAATLAVLGCGVDLIYPRSHHHLAQAISENGAIISDYPLGTAACATNFPRRNRIISGLSCATLVVEAAMRSGSLISAKLANEQNRDVFVVPGSVHNPQSKGCHHLIKQGAILVESAQDILENLNMSPDLEIPQQDTIYRELDSIDSNLLECVGFETRSVQYLIDNLGISAQIVGSRLLKLELRGYIKAVSGGYSRVKL